MQDMIKQVRKQKEINIWASHVVVPHLVCSCEACRFALAVNRFSATLPRQHSAGTININPTESLGSTSEWLHSSQRSIDSGDGVTGRGSIHIGH